MTPDEVRARLAALSDGEYCKFNRKLIPNKTNLLGVRLPALRAVAREIAGGDFRSTLEGFGFRPAEAGVRNPIPNLEWMEETFVCGLTLAYIKIEFEELLARLRGFLPAIDNWAVNDSVCMGLKAFERNRERGWEFLSECFASGYEYDVRFAAVGTLAHFVTEAEIGRSLEALLAISEAGYVEERIQTETLEGLEPGYYVKMAAAWAFSVCFVKFPGETRAAFDRIGDPFVRRKAVQKTLESFRVSDADKAELREYRKSFNA